ncbi:MAG TPA: STAS domain-containing protein [Streptosporangiaceae bacterium]
MSALASAGRPARPLPTRDGCQPPTAMDQPLAIRAEHQRGHTVVTVAGNIGIITAPQLREQLHALAARGRPLVVDLDAVTFLSAAGLRVLATAATRAVAHGGRLHVACGRYQIRRLFLLTGLHHQIPLSHTVAEALAALPPVPAPPGGTAAGLT